MLHFKLSDKQIEDQLSLLSQCEKAAQEIKTYSHEKTDFIKSQSLISNIGASTRIENALLTDTEIEWLTTEIHTEAHNEFRNRETFIKNKLSKDKERSIEEVAGYRIALDLMFSSYGDFFPLRIAAVKGFHRELLKYHYDAQYHHGDYKTQPNSVIEINTITHTKKNVLKTADPGIITDTAMNDLVAWYNSELISNPWPIAVAVEFVFRFLAIHPFQDGNGRLSRLLFQMILLSSKIDALKIILPCMAMDRQIEKTRARYYHVLQQCSGGTFNLDPAVYKYSYFHDYIVNTLKHSFTHISYYAQKYEYFRSLGPSAQKVLNCFKQKPEQRIQTKYLIEETGLPRRTIIYALNQLVDSHFVIQTGKGAGTRYQLVF